MMQRWTRSFARQSTRCGCDLSLLANTQRVGTRSAAEAATTGLEPALIQVRKQGRSTCESPAPVAEPPTTIAAAMIQQRTGNQSPCCVADDWRQPVCTQQAEPVDEQHHRRLPQEAGCAGKTLQVRGHVQPGSESRRWLARGCQQPLAGQDRRQDARAVGEQDPVCARHRVLAGHLSSMLSPWREVPLQTHCVGHSS